jgi:hypothetical protein
MNASRHMFPVSPALALAGPLVVSGETGDSLLDVCRSAQHWLDLAELSFLCGREKCGQSFLDRAQAALESRP